MLKIKFYLLGKRVKDITGGHKYERKLIEIIQGIPDINFEIAIVGAAKRTPKIFAPFIEFWKGVKKSYADIIIFNSSSCLRLLPVIFYLKFFSKKKTYTIHHHFIYLEFSGFKRFIYKVSEALFLKLSDKIIVPSPYIYSILKETRKETELLLWRIPFETNQELPPYPIKGQLTYTGTIEPRKGLIYLMEALKYLQDRKVDYNLNIIGKIINQSYYDSLMKYINDNKLNVKFLGFLDLEEKNKLLSQTDIFTFPSLLEGFGMVLVEAQVYGLPIVCFNNSAMPFTVKNDINGYTVPTGNSEAFASCLENIISNRTLRNRLSKGALDNLNSQWSMMRFKDVVTSYFVNLLINSTKTS